MLLHIAKLKYLGLYNTWLVVDVGHGATFRSDVAQVDLLGLDLDLWAAAQCTYYSLFTRQKNCGKTTVSVLCTNTVVRWKLRCNRH